VKFRNLDSSKIQPLLESAAARFGETTANTLNAFLNTDFKCMRSVYCEEGVKTKRRLMFSVTFTGTVYGEFIMAMDPVLAEKLSREQHIEMLSEILNVTAGQTMQALSKAYPKLSLTTPRVTVGAVLYPRVKSACATVKGVLGEIECHLALDHMQLELSNAYDSAIKALSEFESIGDRIVTTVRKNLANHYVPKRVEGTDVAKIVQGAFDACEIKIRASGIEIRKPIMHEEMHVECNSSEITDVLVELMNQAAAAVRSLKDRWVSLQVVDRLDRIEIEVADSGPQHSNSSRPKYLSPDATHKLAFSPLNESDGLENAKMVATTHHGELRINTSKPYASISLVLPKKAA
jgi:CheY-specific phosphatase CheX